jgi:chorismate mutase
VTPDPEVQRLRGEISRVDRSILDAVNARLALVEELKRHKETVGLAFFDPERERAILEELVGANGGPLSDDGVRKLVGEVLELTKREVGRRDQASR